MRRSPKPLLGGRSSLGRPPPPPPHLLSSPRLGGRSSLGRPPLPLSPPPHRSPPPPLSSRRSSSLLPPLSPPLSPPLPPHPPSSLSSLRRSSRRCGGTKPPVLLSESAAAAAGPRLDGLRASSTSMSASCFFRSRASALSFASNSNSWRSRIYAFLRLITRSALRCFLASSNLRSCSACAAANSSARLNMIADLKAACASIIFCKRFFSTMSSSHFTLVFSVNNFCWEWKNFSSSTWRPW